MNWYLKVLKQYTDFSGRASRREYWMFMLYSLIFASIAMILDNILGIAIEDFGYGPLFGLYILVLLIPGLAVAFRRLHDIGKSGRMILIALIPVIGAIWLLVLLFKEGESNENEYGPNPKNSTTKDSTTEEVIFIYLILAFIGRSFSTIGSKISDNSHYYLFDIINQSLTVLYTIIPLALAMVIRNRMIRIIALVLSGIVFLFRIYFLLKPFIKQLTV